MKRNPLLALFSVACVWCLVCLPGCQIASDNDADGAIGTDGAAGGGTLYVAPSGSDQNDGLTPDTPLLSLQMALDQAKSRKSSRIQLGEGAYTRGKGLNKTGDGASLAKHYVGGSTYNLELLGGWNSGFSAQTGSSTLDAGGVEEGRVVYISDTKKVLMDRINIKGGRIAKRPSGVVYSVPPTAGGGISFYRCTHVTVKNCVVESNSAFDGGGIFVANGEDVQIDCTVFDNHAGNTGGGIRFYSGDRNVIKGEIHDNTSGEDGGGLYMNNDTASTVDAQIFNNKSLADGGGIRMSFCRRTTIKGAIYSNTATDDGGGAYIYGGGENVVLGKIYQNQADDDGGGLFLHNADSYEVDAEITNNQASDDGGGIYLLSGAGNAIKGTVSGNQAGSQGGGIYVSSGTHNITASVSNNIPDNIYKR